MSEHYDFHYQPTGSGAISGQQVLQQTEDAINELGDYVNDNVGGAMDVAQQALETAQTAETNAQTALDTANSFSSAIQSAQQDASTALSTAQTAQTTASNANNTAIQAQQDASSAVTTANNASGQVSTLSGTVTTLGQRVTTAEGNIGQNTSDITALGQRVTTAEGNITTLQNDVSIAQGNASSAMATAGQVKQQAFVFRYSSTALTASSTNSNALLDNTDNLKVGDKVIDSNGVLFSITAIDTQNSTFTIGTVLIDLAQDSEVVHKSGDETIAGVKSFSDDTYIKSLNSTREVASPSSNNVSILPIVANITFTDQSPSQSATLNLRVSADGTKTLYPNENGVYSLGLVSRNWDNVYSYMFESFGKNLGNEFSNNARTNLYLKANRDTGGQSGVYISKFRQNRAQGEMSDTDVVQLTFDILENSVRTNRSWYLNWVNWENNIPKTVEVRSLCEKVDYKLTHINGLNPSSLSLPVAPSSTSFIDISSYITDTTSAVANNFTPPANGYITFSATGTQAQIFSEYGLQSKFSIQSGSTIRGYHPVLKNEAIKIYLLASSIDFFRFIPCQGNV